ncbi:dihydrolipoamide succinyltransferase [Candidatus Bipolaricaulota bacterium]|nr:dihydrolipoamide succinyltransferase [Candidatus Bipolaricaulota bacterium]
MGKNRTEIRIPDLGEVNEVRIVGWLVASGDRVARDQDLLEVETEKTTFVIPSPAEGRVVHGIAAEGTVVSRGAVVGEIEAIE